MNPVQNIKEYEDIPNKYIRVKEEAEGYVVKYSNKAFYDSAWNEYPQLLQARGHIFDKKTGDIIVRPFDKVFNYRQEEAGAEVHPDDMVVAVEKINGFLGVATVLPTGVVIYSTTGTTSSDYAKLVRKHVSGKMEGWFMESVHKTFLFEICDPSDPHIIPEEEGAYLIGVRDVDTGHSYTEDILDLQAIAMGFKRPYWEFTTMEEVVSQAEDCQIEGYMVKTLDENEDYVCKLKSPYYSFIKTLARKNWKDKAQELIDFTSNRGALGMYCFDSIMWMYKSTEAFAEDHEQNKVQFLRRVIDEYYEKEKFYE